MIYNEEANTFLNFGKLIKKSNPKIYDILENMDTWLTYIYSRPPREIPIDKKGPLFNNLTYVYNMTFLLEIF